jgi:hypothetical protein
MVDGLHTPIGNRIKEPLAIALCGVGKGLSRRDKGGNVNNVQYRLIRIVIMNYPPI